MGIINFIKELVKRDHEKDSYKRKKFLFLNRVKNEAINYIKYLKSDVFIKLDDILK